MARLRVGVVIDANSTLEDGFARCRNSILKYGRADLTIVAASHATAERIFDDTSTNVVALTAPTHEWTPETLPLIEAMFAADPDLDMLFGPSSAETALPWSIDRIREFDFLGGVIAVRGELLRRLRGFRTEFYPYHRWELLLRLAEHDPRVGTSALPLGTRARSRPGMMNPECIRRGCEALSAHLDRCGVDAVAGPGMSPGHFVVTPVTSPRPAITVVVPSIASRHAGPHAQTRQLEAFLDRLRQTVAAPHQTIVITSDTISTTEARRLAGIAAPTAIVMPTCRPTSMRWRYLDEAVSHITGDVVVVLDDDVAIQSRDALRTIASIAMNPGIGAVSAVPLRDVDHFASSSADPLRSVRRISTECVAMRRDIFARMNGLIDDPAGQALPTLLRRRGLKTMACPTAFERFRA